MEKKILLVGTDTDNADLLSGLFQARGFGVLTSSSPKTIFDILRDENIDMIFIDFDSEAMNGAKFLQSVRQREPLKEMPILVLGESMDSMATTHSDTAKKNEFLKSHKVQDFILKPYDPEDLINRVEEYFVAAAMNPSAIQKILQKLGKAEPELFEKGKIEGFDREGWQAFRSDFSKIELAMVVPKDMTAEALAKLTKEETRTKVRVFIVFGSTWKKIWPKVDKSETEAA